MYKPVTSPQTTQLQSSQLIRVQPTRLRISAIPPTYHPTHHEKVGAGACHRLRPTALEQLTTTATDVYLGSTWIASRSHDAA